MNFKTKNILLVVLTVLVIILSVALVIIISNQRQKLSTIEGTVLISASDYLLIETKKEDYLVDGTYDDLSDGDTIKVSFKEKSVDRKSTPVSIKPENVTLIEKAKIEDNNDPNNETISKPNTPIGSNTSSTTKPNAPVQNSKTADEEVLEYFEEVDRDFNSGSIKDSLKNSFITVIDFLFYNKPIKGHTFKDLSNSAKLKVLSMAIYFDEKIDKYFPGYKESISKTTGKVYTTAKNEIVCAYLNVAVKVCEQDEELCIKAKEEFGKIKANLGLTWSLIKEIATDGFSSLKNWYEIWREK